MKFTERNCECAACGQWFSTVRNFDRHRYTVRGTDRRACRDAEWLTAKGYVLKAGQWREARNMERLSGVTDDGFAGCTPSLPGVEGEGINTAPIAEPRTEGQSPALSGGVLA